VPELRKDPIIGRWVIISTERGKRPSAFASPEKKPAGGFCPLCPGNEDKTPPEVFAERPPGSHPDTPGWSVRVVPSTEHHDTLATIPPSHLEKILFTYKSRINELYKDGRFKFISVFRNQGEVAGASLAHPHSQMIALPIIPKRLMEELQGARDHFQNKDRCVYCDIIRQEKEHGSRIISENQDFLSLAPFASRFPFETWILPQSHSSSFEEIPKHLYVSLAEIFSETVKRLAITLNDPPYNIMLHTSPLSEKVNDYYHWHFEIFPRLTRVAGFEWGSGFYINPTAPEEAAQFLREATLIPSGK
jgi:UDPglucose--hexose-1-phosphate uridylyltransferase